jgi:hypothetical protein
MNGDLGWPTVLDHATAGSEASSSNAFFTEVLSTPVADNWKKGAADNRTSARAERSTCTIRSTARFSRLPTRRMKDRPTDGRRDGLRRRIVPIDALTREELQAMTAAQLAALTLTPEQISWLTAEQLRSSARKRWRGGRPTNSMP